MYAAIYKYAMFGIFSDGIRSLNDDYDHTTAKNKVEKVFHVPDNDIENGLDTF